MHAVLFYAALPSRTQREALHVQLVLVREDYDGPLSRTNLRSGPGIVMDSVWTFTAYMENPQFLPI